MFYYITVDNKNLVSSVIFCKTEIVSPPSGTYLINNDFMPGYTPNYTPMSQEIVTAYNNIDHSKYVNGQFVPYVKPIRVLTKYAFNSRFTFEELVAITEAAKTDSQVAVLMNKFNIADDIDLTDPVVAYGLNLLVGKTLLTQIRMNEILGIE